MPGTATVTGIIGPAQAVAAAVFSNLTFFGIDTANEMLTLHYDNGSGAKIAMISIAAAATITVTVSGSTYTVTVAN